MATATKPRKMKALTICQPNAELICLGEKRVENRGWSTDYRGPLLIHAGKSREWVETHDGPLPERLVFGAIVGRCELVACVSYRFAHRYPEYRWITRDAHASGPKCLILENVERLERPIPWRGVPGLFVVDYCEIEMSEPFWLPAGPPAQQCRACGCTEHSPCEEGCAWAAEDLCSACADAAHQFIFE